MGVATLSPTAVSIQAAKPSYVYGAAAYIPLLYGKASALMRIGIPADIPSNAAILSATLSIYQYGAYTSASTTLQVVKNTVNWTVSKATWSKAPATGGTVRAVTKAASPSGTLWNFDVTADVQGWLAGGANYGWRFNTTAGTVRQIRGSASPYAKPQLTISYLTPTDAPIGLSPAGNQAVSIAKPWLTFIAPPDTTAVNVVIDATMTAPYDWDSGDIPAVAGAVNLATTAYPGLADGQSVYWRARTKSAFGYSAWSTWAQMQRVLKQPVVITSPGDTTDDTTPPILWNATGQMSWQVVVTDSKGAKVADSGRIVGSDDEWTPPKAVGTDGGSATAEVRVWDAVDRVATAGDTTYSSTTQKFTLTGTATVTPANTVTAANDGFTPAVTIKATRNNVPDSWRVYRDGTEIVKDLESPLTYTDWGAAPNHPHTYQAFPVTNGKRAAVSPAAKLTPTCHGIWLIDPVSPTDRAVIWGMDPGEFNAVELAVIHQPIAGPPVRRVAYRPPLSGSLSGDLVDVPGYPADTQIAVLYDFKGDDRDLRLVVGDRNLRVRIGDLTIAPIPESGRERHSIVSFSWWEQGATPWAP